ncbi:MAG: pyruvate dehydrogenase (acetyl-transferring), homodimeric type, partial [Burkholderiales bacterium]|nr:pyruvate dehydrogenase (acetyl-transferring), homodimeric type [Burkholderiales bacterium]
GEGLQHQDGHSHILFSAVPNCVSYDPSFSYELALIVQDGLRRMISQQEDVYYYITIMNEAFIHPGLADAADPQAREGVLKGLYLLSQGESRKHRVQLLGSGTILREVIEAAQLLAAHWDVAADVWRATSFNELRRDGLECERWSLLHPGEPRRVSYVESRLGERQGPIVASTDHMKAFADQIRAFLPKGRTYRVLGTDGFGRSDSRQKLRYHFEVDRHWVAVSALKALADDGEIPRSVVGEAMRRYGIDPGKPSPLAV